MNQNKLNLTQALVVEGKYDAARLANLVDATILTTDGFAIFKDKTMQALFKRIAAAQGMILLTDSDAAGFKIRHYITGLVGPQNVLQAYIPAVPGKEPRKPEPGKEGLLGVEGVDDALILQGLHTALAAAPLQAQQQNTDPITYTDLYEWGLSGSANASERRRTFLRILGPAAAAEQKRDHSGTQYAVYPRRIAGAAAGDEVTELLQSRKGKPIGWKTSGKGSYPARAAYGSAQKSC